MTTRKPPGNFVCPTCSAGVGQRCLTLDQSPVRETNYHVARSRIAAETNAIKPRADLHDAWAGFIKALTDLGQKSTPEKVKRIPPREVPSVILMGIGAVVAILGLVLAFTAEPHTGDFTPMWVMGGGIILLTGGFIWNSNVSDRW